MTPMWALKQRKKDIAGHKGQQDGQDQGILGSTSEFNTTEYVA